MQQSSAGKKKGFWVFHSHSSIDCMAASDDSNGCLEKLLFLSQRKIQGFWSSALYPGNKPLSYWEGSMGGQISAGKEARACPILLPSWAFQRLCRAP